MAASSAGSASHRPGRPASTIVTSPASSTRYEFTMLSGPTPMQSGCDLHFRPNLLENER